MTPEWSRPERLDAIGERWRSVVIAADAAERAALARRFDLVAIERLEASLALRREAAGIVVEGHVSGAVVQACTVTGDAIATSVDAPLAIRFVAPSRSGEEVELGADALDTVEFEGSAIDLGEAAAETMALSLDPFPRSSGAAEALAAAGVLSEEEAGPFGALAALKAKLAGA